MRIFLVAGAFAFMAACTPVEEADVMSEGCDARGVGAWAAGDTQFSVEATTEGPDCARAVATIVVRNSEGRPIWTESFISEDVMLLAPAQDIAAMNTALGEWTTSATTMQSTSALPEWPANAEAPTNGEFPFYPNEGFSREAYSTMRTNNLPMFCFVQGMESMACLVHGDGGIEHIGVQLFPG